MVDVAVVGPGPAGAMAALHLARQGFSVALIGPAAPRRDSRTVALMEASWRLMEDLGVTPALQAEASPLAMMRLVDDTGSLFRRPPTEFRAAEVGLDQFGWNIDAGRLTDALLAAVDGDPAIMRVDSSVEAVSLSGDAALLTLADGQTLAGRLVVGADGRKSRVREAAGIEARSWSYPQSAITTVVAQTRPHRDISTEFHTRSGPCTTVPMQGRRSAIVWMVPPDEGERLIALDDAGLARAIETRTHSILGQLRIDGPRGLTPMGGLSVERFTGPRAALIGEAAHAFPPIGAQGLNLSVRDVMALARHLDHADPGATEGLAKYESDRAGDVRSRTMAVDALNRSLLADMVGLDFARGFGLLALESIGPLRRFVMRQGLNPSGVVARR
jgi:2-octaprenyl-6-methoxyphenol hydroxylase